VVFENRNTFPFGIRELEQIHVIARAKPEAISRNQLISGDCPPSLAGEAGESGNPMHLIAMPPFEKGGRKGDLKEYVYALGPTNVE